MGSQPFRVIGLSELITALNAVDRDLSRDLKHELKEAGEIVARDAREKLGELSPPSPRSAANIITRVRSAGLVTVEQRLRKTTGKRGDWGVTQMVRAFLPAAEEKQELAVAHIEAAIDNTARDHGF